MSERQDCGSYREYLAGRPEAHRLVQQWIDRVLNHWYSNDKLLRAELSSDVHYAIISHFRDGSDLTGEFSHFVMRIATYKCVDHLRRKRRESSEIGDINDLQSPELNPEQRLELSERSERLAKALLRLGPPCDKLIILRHSEGKTPAELALSLGITEGSLRVKLNRCLARLKKICEALEID